MKARHHRKASGGVVYEGKGSNVVKEAEKRKSGGRVEFYSGAGSNVAEEAEEKKRGGAVKHMGKVHGDKPKSRGDKRARGGRIGGPAGKSGSDKNPMAPYSSKHPFSSACKGG